jgi:glycerol-3-phosphate dehydrogenase
MPAMPPTGALTFGPNQGRVCPPQQGKWDIEVEDTATGVRSSLTASLIVNAAGPWVDEVLKRCSATTMRTMCGWCAAAISWCASCSTTANATSSRTADGRIIFAIPYEQDYTLIGTTDADHDSTMSKPEITPDEVTYLCGAASEYFRQPIKPDDVVWTYSGVRPLFDDGASRAQEATRDYVIKQDGSAADGVLLNIFGGKITTYRRLAETIMDNVEAGLASACQPGRLARLCPAETFPPMALRRSSGNFARPTAGLMIEPPHRLVRHYGTRAKGRTGWLQPRSRRWPGFRSWPDRS